MIHAAWRDLLWRRKRFAIAIAATSLVFSVSLIMSGLSDSFPREVNSLLDAIGAQSYLVASGEAGPFTSTAIVSQDAAPQAAPMMFWSAAIVLPGGIKQVGLIGLPVRWQLPIAKGRAVERDGEVVVDQSAGLDLGSKLKLGSASYAVVGKMAHRTMFGGQPLIILSIHDAQARLAGGAPITRAFVERTTPGTTPPEGLARFSRAQAGEDLSRPMKSATESIAFVKALLWLVAACIVGSVIFLSAIERTRDFAVFKATGVKSVHMGVGLAMQGVIIATFAALLSIVFALALAPLFPMPVTIPLSAALQLPFLAIAIGLLASLVGLRRTVKVDPADAFGGR